MKLQTLMAKLSDAVRKHSHLRDGEMMLLDVAVGRATIDGLARASQEEMDSLRFQVRDLTARLDESRREVQRETAYADESARNLDTALERIKELEAQVYPAGAWFCDGCKFTLQQMVMDAHTGAVAAAGKGQGGECPNCDTSLRRKTWREEAEEMLDRAVEFQDRLRALEAPETPQKPH